MEDRLFDKIRESSESHPELQMPADALAQFKEFSRKKDAPAKPYALYYLLAALLTLLAASNLYWYLSQSNQPSQGKNSILITETTDTVYITKYMNQSSADALTDDSSILISKEEGDSLKSDTDKQRTLNATIASLENKLAVMQKSHSTLLADRVRDARKSIIDSAQNSNRSLLTDASPEESRRAIDRPQHTLVPDKHTVTTGELVASPMGKINLLDKLPIGLVESVSASVRFKRLLPIYIDVPQKSSFLESIRPKALSILAYGGLHLETIGDQNYLSGFQAGTGLSTLFSDRYRGRFTLAYSSSAGEIEDFTSIPAGVTIPDIPENGILDDVCLTSRYISASLGMDYLFKPVRFIRPYVGVHSSLGYQQYTDLEYKFIVRNEERELGAPDSDVSTNHHIGVNAGTDINVSYNFDAFINLNYNHGLSGNIKSYLRLNSGIQYHF